MPDYNPTDKLQRLNQVTLGMFLAVVLSLVFWSVLRTPILAREDNPRLVEAELRIERGVIFDRNDVVLAETVGPPDRLIRRYPIPAIGPAVGYYSFRHGTAGVEESFDSLLRQGEMSFVADWSRQLLHQPLSGWDIRLTVDAVWQKTADSLLPPHSGALILLELPSNATYADILALVSHPGYDPNTLDETFDALLAEESAPLLNRVTQGQYQPGLTLQPFILAAALEQNLLALDALVEDADQPISLNGATLGCLSQPPDAATWRDVLQHACPGPLQALADQLGVAGLDNIFANFQFTTPPIVPLDVETAESAPLINPLLAGIGQENLTITPLQLALAWAGLAQNGRIPPARLVTHAQDQSGTWQAVEPPQTTTNQSVNLETAVSLRQALVHYENLLEHTVLVLSGPEGSTNVWYMGMAPAIRPRFVVVVVVEKSEDITAVQAIGRGLLTAVLQTTNE